MGRRVGGCREGKWKEEKKLCGRARVCTKWYSEQNRCVDWPRTATACTSRQQVARDETAESFEGGNSLHVPPPYSACVQARSAVRIQSAACSGFPHGPTLEMDWGWPMDWGLDGAATPVAPQGLEVFTPLSTSSSGVLRRVLLRVRQ